MQDRFAVKLFAAAQAMGIHTALNTNGSLGSRLTDDELEKVDLVIMDIKTWDPGRHIHLTGKDVGPTLDFARLLAARKRPLRVRFVVVPGLTDNDEDISQIAKFAAGLGNGELVDVLPFHQLGKFKWKALGIAYALEQTPPPPPDQLEHVCGLFRAFGLRAH